MRAGYYGVSYFVTGELGFAVGLTWEEIGTRECDDQ